MSYFKNTAYVPYKFGTSNTYTLHQDISVYVDIVDQVRNNGAFYQKYTILDGDRPDNLSQKLYKSPKYYWTFFLMNDKLRERGWPMSNQKILELVKSERNNTTLTTRDDLTGIFNVGSTVTGQSSGATGTIIKRRLDLGQIIIEGDKSFQSTEIIRTTEDGDLHTATLVGAVHQYDSVHHYEDADGNWVDVNPYTAPGSSYSAISYYDRYVLENESLKDIVVLKPDVVSAVFTQFQESMRTEVN